MITSEKTFRIKIIVYKSNNIIVIFKKKNTQINQNSNINVIFINFIRYLDLSLRFLKKINFKDLFIRIIDHREIVLYH